MPCDGMLLRRRVVSAVFDTNVQLKGRPADEGVESPKIRAGDAMLEGRAAVDDLRLPNKIVSFGDWIRRD